MYRNIPPAFAIFIQSMPKICNVWADNLLHASTFYDERVERNASAQNFVPKNDLLGRTCLKPEEHIFRPMACYPPDSEPGGTLIAREFLNQPWSALALVATKFC
jgi:hypothetical protein